jgi:hypothetical protein
MSIDEMTGIQALERIAPGLPLVPGKVERCEFEYKRHGTERDLSSEKQRTKRTAWRRGWRADRSLSERACRESASARSISQSVCAGDRKVRPI